ncbi:MAG: DUF512 domain-containing protein [Firmicutes bacterium]|nr:DUF512 domain-containing protein [Bacillota bacterium]
MQTPGLIIETVDECGIAAELGLESGDKILQINGADIKDILDYRYLSAEENLLVLAQKAKGGQWLLEIEKDYDEDLGVSFPDSGLGRIQHCRNRCVFCFVDQMPPRMRPSLYIKDDDYRLSFAQGNFITLTNTGPAELERIASMRLSPLFVSVHTTNPELRRQMVGHPSAGGIMEQLRFLAGAGIEIHTQAVLCPGLNDGEELDRTIRDLNALWPAVRSLAVVPVGLTDYRRGLYRLRNFLADEARAVVEQVHRWQKICNSRRHDPFVFAGDEFYLTAGLPIPSAAGYGGFPQIENGVGLVRLFIDEWHRTRDSLPRRVNRPVTLSLVTGALAAPLLQQVAERLNRIRNVSARLYVLKNTFFGHNVTVAGLLTGRDIVNALNGCDLGERLFIPRVMLRNGANTFLDDMDVDELSRRLGVNVIPVDGPKNLVEETVC